MSDLRSPSQLILAEHCGHSAHLSAQYPQGTTYAEDGTEKHRIMADVVMGRRAHKEYESVVSSLPDGAREAELPIEAPIDPMTGAPLFRVGSKDAAHRSRLDVKITAPDGGIYVGDWKFGDPWKVPPADDNLQVLAYGLAEAMRTHAPWFKVFLWFERTGFDWGSRKWTPDAWQEVIDRIAQANSTPPDRPVVGGHCDGCYTRTYCRAWLLPTVEQGASALAPFTRPGGINEDNAPMAALAVKQMDDALKIAKKQVEDYARVNGPIVAGPQEYGPVFTSGRRYISIESVGDRSVSVERDGKVVRLPLIRVLEDEGCVGKTRDTESYRWANSGKKRAKKKSAEQDGPGLFDAPPGNKNA